jgi:exodeoxyribonuclease V gamma subunit
MDEGAYPRASHVTDFDLTRPGPGPGSARRPGDRSRRDDDRFLFLEAIMAARERLLILFTGQSIRDNSKVPPSVVLNELLDHLRAAFGILPRRASSSSGQGTVHPPLLVEHPLQPFSVRYFDGRDPELFSYAQSYCEGARSLQGEPAADHALFEAALDCADLEPNASVALVELLRFFESPIRYLFNRCLKVYLNEGPLDVPDREPCELSKLEEWAIGRTLLELDLDAAAADSYALVNASGSLPAGVSGAYLHDVLRRQAQPIAEIVRQLRRGAGLPNLPIDLQLPCGTRLVGEIGHRWPSGLVIAQYSRVTGKQVLATWIRHLVLCSALPDAPDAPDAPDQSSVLVGRPPQSKSPEAYVLCAWDRVSDPARELSRLVDLYRIGQTQPLLLFPKSSFEYARVLLGTQNLDRALRAAREAWGKSQGANERMGESSDPHLLRLFGAEYQPGEPPPFAVDPSLSFEELAEAVFTPLLEQLLPARVVRGRLEVEEEVLALPRTSA